MVVVAVFTIRLFSVCLIAFHLIILMISYISVHIASVVLFLLCCFFYFYLYFICGCNFCLLSDGRHGVCCRIVLGIITKKNILEHLEELKQHVEPLVISPAHAPHSAC